ncbi:MAG: hypothetical protein KGI27_01770 [Thaumarchaeota archaeon]|nr:hypothetical protein [Nitrososphaerota archaeon]
MKINLSPRIFAELMKLCGSKKLSPSDFISHLIEEYAKVGDDQREQPRFTCNYCSHRYFSGENLAHHIKTIHMKVSQQ